MEPDEAGLADLVVGYQAVHEIVLSFPVPAFIKDASSRFVICNQALADFVQVSRDDMIGKRDADMPWGDDHAATYRSWDRRVVETGEPVLKLVEGITTSIGRVHTVETNKFPLRDSSGTIVGVFGQFSQSGHEAPTDKTWARPKSAAFVEDLVLRYLSGESVSQIAETTGIAPSGVYRALRDQGLAAEWQPYPASWAQYPVFRETVRNCRLALTRTKLKLDRAAHNNSLHAEDIAMVQRQIATLNQALADTEIHTVRDIADTYLQNRIHELTKLTDEATLVADSDRTTGYPPSVMHRRYRSELERIESDRIAIIHELKRRIID